MNELEVLELYDKSSDNQVTSFSKSLNSSLQVNADYNKVECDTEWVEKMEDTIKYIDNILRNPNRFIVNEEDIVKIELARKITVESVKHLSRNTNLIQKIEDNGDVKPSKILNINKDESFNTYENRFVYSLIQNMRMFIDRKKKGMSGASGLKSTKKLEYKASTNVAGEKVNIALQLDSALDKDNSKDKETGLTLDQRIEKLELNISDLTTSDVYQSIHKLKVSLVTSPIKKTNVILKNTNFQNVLKLWNYMQENIDDKTKKENKKLSYEDDGTLKKYIDETFLLNYLVADTINKEEMDEEVTKKLSDKMVDNMILKLVELNPTMTEVEIKDMIGEKYAKVKYNYKINDTEIHRIYKDAMDKYLKNIEELRI